MTSLLQRGCVKSVQLINQWVKTTHISETTTLQVDINQVNPAKSFVVFYEIKYATGDPSNETHYEPINENFNFELHSIESRCVTFKRYGDTPNVQWFFHVVFQLVEFY